MRICDRCRDPRRPVGQLRLGIDRPEPDGSRARPKPVRSMPVDLCDGCIEEVWEAIAAAYDVKCELPARTPAGGTGTEESGDKAA